MIIDWAASGFVFISGGIVCFVLFFRQKTGIWKTKWKNIF